MIEVDFETEEGREKTRQQIMDIVQNDNKEDMCDLLSSMLEYIVKHEINFKNIKTIIE